MNYLKDNSISFYLFFFFIFSLILGNAAVNIVSLLIFFFVIYNLKKININNQLILLFLFFFSIITNSIIKNQNLLDLGLVRFLILTLFGYLFYKNINFEIKKIFRIFMLAISIVAIDNILIESFGRNIYFSNEFNITTQKVTSLFGDEQIFGSYLSKLIILILSYVYCSEKKLNINFSNIFYSIVFCLGLYAVIISDERRAILEIILAFIFLNLLQPNNIKLLISLSITAILSLIIFINPIFKDKIINKSLAQLGLNKSITFSDQKKFGILFLDDNSFKNNQYYAMYKTAYNIWLDNKFLGGGHKSYRELCKNQKYQYDDRYSLIRCNSHPHSIYLQILSEFGLISFILFIILNLILIIKALSMDKDKLFMYPSLILLATLLIPLPSGNIFSTWIGSIFWLNLGILLNASESKNKSKLT
tara:strand:+ start:246 stop:1502 length:1257 start_codon:yes stop_codon:yes gene_type:complete